MNNASNYTKICYNIKMHLILFCRYILSTMLKTLFDKFSRFKSIDNVARNGNILSCQTSDRQNTARVVCISDTHNRFRELAIPEGDILIHAGDISLRGHLSELKAVSYTHLTLPTNREV